MSKYQSLKDDDQAIVPPSASPVLQPASLALDDNDRLAFQQFTASASPVPPAGTSPAPPAASPTPLVAGKMGTPAAGSYSTAPIPSSPTTATAAGGGAGPEPMRQPLPPPADAKMWQIEYYARYFDVDTADILLRARLALYPNNQFVSALAVKQELYGPFWVPTTLIFALFVTSSLAHSIASYMAAKPYVYDFTRLSAAMSTVYAYTFATPSAMWGVSRYYGRHLGLLDLWAIYGYGMAMWIPITLVCVVPIDAVRWILVALAFLLTGLFLGRNVHLQLTELTTNRPQAIPGHVVKFVLLAAAAAHAVFALLLKLLFFSYTISE
ncbi:hypothetical protein H9P43_006091 [Blastocladiella emersonii ATCC 22665]|nr:hypothetical protein H9P43_006091 [Blastocladiella emersonii ATCC 22665]